MNEVHPKMTWADAKEIYARHNLIIGDWPEPIATVLGGLEAELAEKDAKIAALQAQCEEYAALLIGQRGENAKLRAAISEIGMAAANELNRLDVTMFGDGGITGDVLLGILDISNTTD